MSAPLILIGGGGHAKVVYDAAEAAGLQIAGFLDDRPTAPIAQLGVKYLGPTSGQIQHDPAGALAPAIGDNLTRRTISLRLVEERGPARLGTVIHPSALISRHGAIVEPGAFIGPGAIVNPGSRVGTGAIVNSGAIVEHDCDLGPWCHVGPGAALGGSVRVGEQSLVGLGARILPGLRVGARATVGAGAVVTRDVPDGAVVRGNPARSD